MYVILDIGKHEICCSDSSPLSGAFPESVKGQPQTIYSAVHVSRRDDQLNNSMYNFKGPFYRMTLTTRDIKQISALILHNIGRKVGELNAEIALEKFQTK